MRPPLCLFDLDETLVEGRALYQVAHHFGFLDALDRHEAEDPAAVARHLEGVPLGDLHSAWRDPPLRPGAAPLLDDLYQMGFHIGVATSGYRQMLDALRARRLDVTVAPSLEAEDGVLTGRLEPSAFGSDCCGPFCKERASAALRDTTDAFYTVAVADGRDDVCLLRHADLGIALEPADPEARAAADIVVRDLAQVAPIVRHNLQVLRL